MAHAGLNHYSGTSVLSRGKKSNGEQALGRSSGGFSTKIHALCDSHGNPLRFILTSGERSDYTQAKALLKNQKAQVVLADRGYDADYIVEAIEAMGGEAVIPCKKNRNTFRPHDKHLYKERNLVERLFNKLKNFRRVATRYDKLDITFHSFICLAGIYLWLK
jgi:transposase